MSAVTRHCSISTRPRWRVLPHCCYLVSAYSQLRRLSTNADRLPKLAQPSIWQSIIPKALRSSQKRTPPGKKKPPNPAVYFIWIYLFIGSQAIRIIGVQNEFNTFMRKAEVKIGKLREVIEKLQRDEPVDVEKVLGTGDELQELEWEEALREIENEEHLWQSNRQRRRDAKAKHEAEEQEASPVNEDKMTTSIVPLTEQTTMRPAPGFY